MIHLKSDLEFCFEMKFSIENSTDVKKVDAIYFLMIDVFSLYFVLQNLKKKRKERKKETNKQKNLRLQSN